MRFRPAALRQALTLAAVFVAARVAYRVLFDGASGTGAVLLDWPVVRLGGPFADVPLLGPVSGGGLWLTALSALPFAVAIIAFGLLNALVDLRPWAAAAARRGPWRSLARSVVIAWDALPGLAVASRRMSHAAALRGTRRGPRTLVPLFEHVVEHAVALAASLEVRGFAATRRVEGACEHPVDINGAVLARADGWHLTVPRVRLAPGELVVVAGGTGSGKSTLLDALSGLFQHVDEGTQSGRVDVGGVPRVQIPPRETAGFVGVVAQDVKAAFAASTTTEEIGLALVTRGVASVIVADRVRETAQRLGIEHLLGRGIAELSAGEAVLVALAAALIERPSLLLVDEPLAELDGEARERVVGLLSALAHEAGVCVVVAEHRLERFRGWADRWFQVADGAVAEMGAAETVAAATVAVRADAAAGAVREAAEPVLEVRALGVFQRAPGRRGPERVVVTEASLTMSAGEIVALHGPNGAGKSSLLHAIALPESADTVSVRGLDVRKLRPRRRHAAVALVPETVEDLFVADTVAGECARADRRARAARGATEARFSELLGGASGDLGVRHPRDLSGGQKLCLAVALQLAGSPAVLLVDEPVRGLDADASAQVSSALRRAAMDGTAVLFATHEDAFARALAERSLRMYDGRLTAPSIRMREAAS